MRRVLVIGSGGAGKTTLARRIAAATGLPLVHLDRRFWHAGWHPTPAEEWARIVTELAAEERWVMDGNYGGTLPARLARADTVVFLDVSRVTCLVRVVRRAARHRSRPREDMAPGCPEHVTWEFARWIWRYPKTSRPGVLSMLDEFRRGGGRALVLHTDAEVRTFVASLSPGGDEAMAAASGLQ